MLVLEQSLAALSLVMPGNFNGQIRACLKWLETSEIIIANLYKVPTLCLALYFKGFAHIMSLNSPFVIASKCQNKF